MRSATRVFAPLCLVIGAALLADALATGGARLYLLLIFPVVTGTTLVFGLSVLFLVLGFLLVPFAFVTGAMPELLSPPLTSPSPPPPSGSEDSGGLILIGPVPIFFGGWRRNPPISYRWAVLVGVVLAVVAVLLLWGLSVL
jgi:uncharacterized membrane protein